MVHWRGLDVLTSGLHRVSPARSSTRLAYRCSSNMGIWDRWYDCMPQSLEVFAFQKFLPYNSMLWHFNFCFIIIWYYEVATRTEAWLLILKMNKTRLFRFVTCNLDCLPLSANAWLLVFIVTFQAQCMRCSFLYRKVINWLSFTVTCISVLIFCKNS